MPKSQKTESTVIIGMGPSGLLTACYLLKQGQRVTLIDTRDNSRLFTREQPIVLPPEFLIALVEDLSNYGANGYKICFTNEFNGKYEFTLVKNPQHTVKNSTPIISAIDHEFFSMAKQYHRALPIHVIQEYLLKKVQEVSLLMQNESNPLEIINPASVININSITGAILIKCSDEFIESHFDNIVIAAGANREIIKNLLKIDQLQETDLPTPRRKIVKCGTMHLEYKGTIDQAALNRIRMRPRIGPVGRGISNMRPEYLKTLQAAGWQEKYLPLYFTTCNCNAEKLEFNFAGEIPATLNKEAPQEFLKWGKTILQCEYPNLDVEHLQLAAEDYNPFLSFELKPSYIDKAFIKLGSTRVFIIGDALLKANFFMGHGLGNATFGAHAVTNCFKNGRFISSAPADAIISALCNEYMTIDAHLQLLVYLRENPIQYQLFFGAASAKEEACNTLRWLFSAKTSKIEDAPHLRGAIKNA